MHTLLSPRFVGFAAAVAVAAATVAAQQPGPAAPIPSPVPSPLFMGLTGVWRLDPATHFEDSSGIIFVESVKFRGTANFTRSPQTTAAADQVFQLKDLNWLITPNLGEEFYVSGWGEYRITRSVGPLTVIGHRMTVNVKWGSDTALRRFDSGLIPMSNSQAGRHVDIVMREVFTTDPGWPNPAPNAARPSLRLKAAAVPHREITPYAALAGQSEFLNGCYDPCSCPISLQPMQGKFGVVALPGPVSHLATTEWAMVNMRFDVRPFATTPAPTPGAIQRSFAGAGILQQFPQTGATLAPRQRLRANLSDSLPTFAAQTQRFDSGLVERTVAWPRIDVSIADNNFYCFNRVLHIAAAPVPTFISLPAPEPIPMPYPGPVIPIDDR